MSLVDLPAHVALTILRRLDARDLCALRATCRAFDAALVETAAFEATRARAPWLAAPRLLDIEDGRGERSNASAKGDDESWLDVLRFSELAAAARLPNVVAAEDVTAVVDREGRVHVWGPVVDAHGHERDEPREMYRTLREESGDGERNRETGAERTPSTDSSTRCVVAAAGYACSFGAGGERGGFRAFRNVAGVEGSPGSGPGNLAGRPPPSPGAARAARLAVGGPSSSPRIVSIAIGRMHALAAAADGSLWTWGNDAAGQLGLGQLGRASATLAQFSGSLELFSSSPKSRDRARRMRRDRDGAGGSPRAASPGLGANADARKFFPGAGGEFFSKSSPGGHPHLQNDDAASFLFPGRESGDERSAGGSNAMMRRVECFSDFSRRAAGDGEETKSVFFVVKVAASRHGSACVTADGALFCWGSNRRGALGLGDDLDRDVPTRVRVCASSGDEGYDDSDDDSDSDDETNASGSDSSDERDGATGSPTRASSRAAWKFPGALSDSDSDSDAERARAAKLREAKGKAPASPSGARARDGAPRKKRREKRMTRRDAVVTAFSYGARHAAAVTSRGELFCWGDNRQWQCGRAGGSRGPDAVLWPTRIELQLGSSDDDDDDDGFDERFDEDDDEDDDVSMPRRRENGEASEKEKKAKKKTKKKRQKPFATDAAAGATHTLALDASGRVWSFGTGHGLAPGDPVDGYDETMYDPREGHSRRPPERARGVPRAVKIAAGARHSAVVVEERQKRDAFFELRENMERAGTGKSTGLLHVYTWGANDAGQLGGKDRAPARPTPTRVASFPTSYYVQPGSLVRKY